MSVTAISRTFWTEFPTLSYADKNGKQVTIKATTAKIVLLAIADNADDFGENSFQSFETLAAKASVERRSVMRVVRALTAQGFLKVAGISVYGTNNYSIILDKLGNPPTKRAKTGRPKSGDSEARTGDSGTKSGDSEAESGDPQSPDPSFIPPLPTPQPLAALSEKDYKDANAQVAAMVELSKKAKYENRDKIPEQYLALCDLYVEVSGQKPSKRVLMDWLATFSDWIGEGLQPVDVRAAYQYATRPDGGFMVSRPGSLTNTAVALKSKAQAVAPKIDQANIDATKQMIEKKTGGNFSPRPDNVPDPVIVKQRLAEVAQQRGIRK